MEFLVEFETRVPEGTLQSEVLDREHGEAAAAAKLASEGHLLRVWKRRRSTGEVTVLGLYRAASERELSGLLVSLPLYPWMTVTVTPLEPHPNDPSSSSTGPAPDKPAAGEPLPAPYLTRLYRLEATLGDPLDLGDTGRGRRRIVPLTGGSFSGPALRGALLPGASADWQTVLADETALADVRCTLQTDHGALMYVQSRGVRHGSAAVLTRLARGEEVDASEYTFRTATQIETAFPELAWLNKGVFISVGGRRPGGVTYETYLVS
jgi:muconolactone delta-isomerase